MLRAWLHNRFPTEGDVDDIVQEAYLRLWQMYEVGKITSPKAYLFATARNLALLKLRRQNSTARFALGELDDSVLLDDDASVPESVSRAEDLELLTKALQSLPPRCRQILTLRKIYGLSQREVAAQLGLSVRTVEGQVAIGMRKIELFFERLNGKDTVG
jgi:RNA polymerase sigma factor (sigma-70 family)